MDVAVATTTGTGNVPNLVHIPDSWPRKPGYLLCMLTLLLATTFVLAVTGLRGALLGTGKPYRSFLLLLGKILANLFRHGGRFSVQSGCSLFKFGRSVQVCVQSAGITRSPR
jgi:hypothetical protein